ncbi:CDP-glycerol glycerophosphotransferase family protein [Endothiovibrio diazotrophicus]
MPSSTHGEYAVDVWTSNIVITLVFEWHRPILEPLRDILAARGHAVETIRVNDLRAGWRPRIIPDLLVTADAGPAQFIGETFPGVPILHVGHGLISKNQPGLYYPLVDYVCVSGEDTARRLEARGHTPRKRIFATGMIQSDPLFRGDTAPVRVAACPTCIAYTPTWNPELNSARMLGREVVERIRGTDTAIGVVIKPHPHIAVSDPEMIALWRELAATRPNVVLHDPDADLIPVLLGADLLVSDASSAIFHYLALDRPIVLIDNPARTGAVATFDPQGIEWTRRDIARCVTAAHTLSDAVVAELADPDARRPARQARRRELFGELTDGRARERVAGVVEEILRNEAWIGARKGEADER